MTAPAPDDGLAPCPFCGGEAEAILVSDGWAIQCKACAMQTGFDTTEEKSARAWNTRVAASDRDVLVADNKRLRESVVVLNDAILAYPGSLTAVQANALNIGRAALIPLAGEL